MALNSLAGDMVFVFSMIIIIKDVVDLTCLLLGKAGSVPANPKEDFNDPIQLIMFILNIVQLSMFH